MRRPLTTLALVLVAAGALSACGGRDKDGATATEAAETTGPASDANALPPATPPAATPPTGEPMPSTPPILPPDAETPMPSPDTPPTGTTPR